MLQRMALASSKVLASLHSPCRRSSLIGNKDALCAPALSRSLTGGEVREAARNAKAYLLRAHAASSQARDAQTATPAQSSFLNLSVDDRVVGRLQENDVQKPTAVQVAAIPAIISGRNVAMQCYTGSGKTLAYLLPVLSKAIQNAEKEFVALQQQGKAHEAGTLQALVVVPSRELAMQIVRVAQGLLPHDARATIQQCIGGANPTRQAEALKLNKPLMVVGTPGRLTELSRMGRLQTHSCPILVLDEVDQLLEYHFEEDMTRLTQHCGKKLKEGRQTIIVSATLKDQVLREASQWCPDAEKVFVSPTGQLVEPAAAQQQMVAPHANGVPQPQAPAEKPPPDLPPQLQHLYVETSRRHRVDAVRRCIHAADLQRVLDTQIKLSARGMSVGCLHGELDKAQRQNVLARFKRGEHRALIVSDVAARGLDVPDCDAVINLELPSGPDHYAHRAGRTGRAGRSGLVISIAEPDTLFVINKMAKRLQIAIAKAAVSEGVLAWDEQEAGKRPAAVRQVVAG
ncbi:MAG: ATP-dependent RNA helicase [Trebouxia sp. A1-2]|nr:MAG: ATP-dependent RNA helicase [Trebouxia sp. A1-2]